MAETPAISVIVPVYNVEQYLGLSLIHICLSFSASTIAFLVSLACLE